MFESILFFLFDKRLSRFGLIRGLGLGVLILGNVDLKQLNWYFAFLKKNALQCI